MNRTNTVVLVSEMNTLNNILINTLDKQGFCTTLTNSFEEDIKNAIFINLPDILLIDYDIVNIDLDIIIKYFKEEYNSKKKIVLMVTRMPRSQKIQMQNKGVDLIVDKPFNFGYLCNKLNKLLNNQEINLELKCDTQVDEYTLERLFEISQEEIFKMGITVNSKAWAKFCDVIAVTVNNKGNVDKVRKNVYLEVAKKYNTTDEGIDSTLRRCISTIWKNGDKEYLKKYFDIYKDDNWDKLKPTNKQFLKTVSNAIIKKLTRIDKFKKVLSYK